MKSPLPVVCKLLSALLVIAGGLVIGCDFQPKQSEKINPAADSNAAAVLNQSASVAPGDDFAEVQKILLSSCMPCHNRQNLPVVIDRVKKASFKDIDGDTRLRILGELEELEQYMKDGMPISFTGKEEVHKFFNATPGEFYMMLEKGLMPPPWAPELMKQIEWPSYQKITIEKRLTLLKYAKPYTQKYLR